ncbi:MAG: hypothetical protein AABX85_04715 [Nanoarchaeota archaeon]
MDITEYLVERNEKASGRNHALRLIRSEQPTLTLNSIGGETYFVRSRLLWRQYKNTFNTNDYTKIIYSDFSEYD